MSNYGPSKLLAHSTFKERVSNGGRYCFVQLTRETIPLTTFTASMEIFSLHLKAHTPIHHLVLFSLHLFSSQFLSLAYNVPDKYFVNCGSNRDLNDAGRRFAGDLNSDSFFFPENGSKVVEDDSRSANSSSLYFSARVFFEPSVYVFQIDNPGTYLVRLHFYPFSSSIDLSTALFGVSASGYYLLQNFSADSNRSSPLIEEFFLRITTEKLKIYFLPNSPSIAFVNAMEVFLAPPKLIPDQAELIGPSGSITSSKSMSSLIFHTLYRINVGKLAVNSSDDKLWRNWNLDDGYLLNRSVARNTDVYQNKLYYKDDDGEYIAPPLVYQTAKELNTVSDESTSDLITWSFPVRKNATHFVRAHFCDIFGTPSIGLIVFNLSIDRNFSENIRTIYLTNQLAAPFYLNFLVDSDSYRTVNISVGPVNDSDVKNAYLNGLEILESLEIRASVPDISVDDRNKSSHLPLVIGAVAGGFAVSCILGAVIWLVLKRMKPTVVENSEWTLVPIHKGGSSHSRVTEATAHGSPLPNLNLGLTIPFAEILTATKNFHIKLLIGKGGFGNVYQGILRNGTKVAVKRCHPGSSQGLPEFEREVMVLSKIRHKTLVSLVGYCDERSEMILVYEFMENGTLREHLYGSQLPPLSWTQRLEICIGAAKGLHYLHKGSAGGIIHRDVKSTNILLDENLSAKVADFGLSRVGPVDGTHVSTAVKGTFGYLDPEYFRTQQLTEKSDVYSFGVVLFEVLCARPAINPLLPRDQMNLAELGIRSTQQGLVEQIIDPLLHGQINPSSLRKFSETAAKCLRDDGDDRPSMADVLWDLEYSLKLQQPAVIAEPYDDSTVDATANFHRSPSGGSAISVDE